MQIDLKSFNVAGVQYRPANVIDELSTGQQIRLIAEPTNTHDKFAIKVEAFKPHMISEEDKDGDWNFIGYVPRKDTWLLHIMRQAGIHIDLKFFVNHDAADHDKLLVIASFEGDTEKEFI